MTNTYHLWRTSYIPGKTGPVLPGISDILVGPAATVAEQACLTDISPQGRRLDNSMFSELSAMWRIWKYGPTSDIIGWCHYCRYFGLIKHPWITLDIRTTCPWNNFLSLKTVSFPMISTILPTPPQSQWLEPLTWTSPFIVNGVSGTILKIIGNIGSKVIELHPHLAPWIAEQFHSKKLFACLMFICTRQLFDEFCNLWFTTLTAWLDGRKQLYTGVNTYQNRTPGFLAERLFTAWINYKQRQAITVLQLPLVYVEGV